jgi:hypothetical protein
MTFFRPGTNKAVVIVFAFIFSQGCGDSAPREMQAAPVAAPSEAADPVLVGAGDIASCQSSGDEATSRLLDAIPGTVITLGDNAYQSDDENPMSCYAASWGRHKHRTRPVPGNHEYLEGYIDQYFDYFGDAAGERGKGYYSYNLGRWHVIALNSNIDAHWSGDQGEWLRADLERNRHGCTLAYFHHPRFSSGPREIAKQAEELWWMLAEAGVDVVVTAHDHFYERFAPLDKHGDRNDEEGMRSFIVGTGGASRSRVRREAPNSEVRNSTTFGVLKLTLKSGGYDWKFVPVRGGTFTDSGSGSCH